ncbi:antiterminator LoaP [Paenibacillus sp. FSL H8-0259]|jgi:transcription termination/antitermination protein NusG|uniref:antiterminator LoaP n=2 Tax=Paenibacillus TaxID=44249 RepID=UPI0009FB28F7|nr:antiterminator LoaP [Paenibacillus sp. FSL H8-0259]
MLIITSLGIHSSESPPVSNLLLLGDIMSWYVLFVRNGCEDRVKSSLQRLFSGEMLRCVVPKKQISERRAGQYDLIERLLFPGYVFIQTQMNYSTYYILQKNPHVYRLLNYCSRKDLIYKHQAMNDLENSEEQYFKQIPEEEISPILGLLDHDDVAENSRVYFENSRMNVVSGPLTGKEELVTKVDKRKRRAKVSLQLLGGGRTIDLGIILLEPETNLVQE